MEEYKLKSEQVPLYTDAVAHVDKEGDWKCMMCNKVLCTPKSMVKHFKEKHLEEWKKQKEIDWCNRGNRDIKKWKFAWCNRVEYFVYDCSDYHYSDDAIDDELCVKYDKILCFYINSDRYMFEWRSKTREDLNQALEEVELRRVSQKVTLGNIGKHIEKAMGLPQGKPNRIILEQDSSGKFTVKAEYKKE